jgi:hypothetical protein
MWYQVGGRWGRPGVRRQNEEHLLSALCPLLSVYCVCVEFELAGL